MVNSTLEGQESEISLLDIVNFLIDSWKKLAIAGAIGAVLGISGWFFLANFQAEYVLVNNIIKDKNNSYALDLISWKAIQKSLPNLAAQIEDEGMAPMGKSQLYKSLASEQWWQKNVIPSFAISKADTKDLAAISKDLDLASTTILSFTIKADGSTKKKAIENVRAAAAFLRTGSAYLELRSILNSYEIETISAVADLQKRITAAEIEMGYQVARAKSLEDLHKRFPSGANASNQVVDPKDSGAKYLPLATQIIAINNDINQSKEDLMRLRNRLTQIALIKIFLEEAGPLTVKTFNGVILSDDLLTIEERLRSKLPKDDFKQQEVFDLLRTQLLSVKSRYTKSLDSNTAPISTKKGMIKAAAGGLALAFFVMLIVLLSRQIWRNIKSGSAE